MATFDHARMQALQSDLSMTPLNLPERVVLMGAAMSCRHRGFVPPGSAIPLARQPIGRLLDYGLVTLEPLPSEDDRWRLAFGGAAQEALATPFLIEIRDRGLLDDLLA